MLDITPEALQFARTLMYRPQYNMSDFRDTSPDQPCIKILCLGEEDVGKSYFLAQGADTRHLKDSPCSVFVHASFDSLNRRVWTEFYQLSNSSPDYMGCYLEATYDGIVFFYDLADKRSRNRLYIWMRLVQQYKGEEFWNLPVLLVGLKMNLVFGEQIQESILDVASQFKGIFKNECFLYFGKQADQQDQNRIQFQLWVKLLTSKKFGNSNKWAQYKLIRSMKTYNYMYTYYQITREATEKAILKMRETIEAMNIHGILSRGCELYLRFTDKLSTF